MVAVDQRAEVDQHQLAGADDPLARLVVGAGAVRPRRDDGLEADVVGAAVAHLGVQREREPPLGGPVGEQGEHRGQRIVGDGAGRADPRDLAVVLHDAEVFDQAARGHQLGGREPGLGEAPLLGPGDVLRLEADARRRLQVPREDRPLLGDGATDAELRVHAHRGQLAGRLLLVAAVGHEAEPFGVDHEDGGRPGEAGEIADVGEVGDDEGVAPGVVEGGAEAVRSAPDVHRGEGRHARSRATAAIASW